MFSNGTEYGLFLECNCFRCKKYNFEKPRCAIDRKISECQFMDYKEAKAHFPESSIIKGACQKFVDKKERKPVKQHRQLKGQLSVFDLLGGE